MLKVFILAIILVGIAFAGIAIKMFLKKGGEFKKSCGSIDPVTGGIVECSCKSNNPVDCDNE